MLRYGSPIFRGIAASLFLLCTAAGAAAQGTAPKLQLDKITLPPGFSIAVYASDVRNARQLTRGAKGTIFVGTRSAGNVHAVRDDNNDGKADKVHTIATGLTMPNGVAFREGALYVAEVSRILRFDNIEDSLDKPPAPVVVYDKFPDETHHGWKFIAFGPDGLLYVPVGAPCNICDKRTPIRTARSRRLAERDGRRRPFVRS